MNIKTNFTLLRKLKETRDHASTVRLYTAITAHPGRKQPYGETVTFPFAPESNERWQRFK